MYGLLIGRFQPFHLGHLFAVKFALSKVEKLWIGIGSSNKSNEKNNPFSAEERNEMILASIDNTMAKRIKIYYIPDVDDHENWTFKVDSIVPEYDIVFSNDALTQSLYSKRDIKIMPVSLKQRETLSGTFIRSRIVKDQSWEELVPQGTRSVLKKINAKERLKIL